MSTLIVAEHDNTTLKPATLNAVTAAGQLPGETHILVAGSGCAAAAQAAAKIAGVTKVLQADDAAYAHGLDENLAPRRSEEHTSELQSLMRNSYAVVGVKKKNKE